MSVSRGLHPTTRQQLTFTVVRLPSSDPRCALITADQLNAIVALIAASVSEVSA